MASGEHSGECMQLRFDLSLKGRLLQLTTYNFNLHLKVKVKVNLSLTLTLR